MKAWEEKSWFKRKVMRSRPMDPAVHAKKLSVCLEDLGDAFLRTEKGKTAKAVGSIVAAKIAAASAAPAALFSLASVFGTASTGTAIGSLSGAAFNNAALAWLGGSVFGGTLLVGAAGLATGFAGIYGLKKLNALFRSERKEEELPEDEKIVFSGIIEIAERLKDGKVLSGPALLSFWNLNLEPMLLQLDTLVDHRFSDWKKRDLKRLNKAINKLKRLGEKTEYKLSSNLAVPISAFSAVITKLYLAESRFSEDDRLVMEAFTRSTNELEEGASPEEIGAYIDKFEDPAARQGMLSNVKGIYHEIAYTDNENKDGDIWFVEMSTKTNEPGVDVWLINSLTGERTPFQLKASNTSSTSKTHYENYDFGILGTDEIVSEDKGIEASGFSNEELTEQTLSTADKLQANDSLRQLAEESVTAASVAGAISFSIALGKSLSDGKPLSKSAMESLGPAKKAFLVGTVLATVTGLTL